MMKTKATIVLIVLVLTLTGCGNNSSRKLIKQAKSEIEAKEYDKVLSSLRLALYEDNDNVEAEKLRSIVESYKNAKRLMEENNIDEASKLIDEIDEEYINYGIKEEVDKLKIDLDNKVIEIAKVEVHIKEIDKLFNNMEYEECKSYIVNNLLGLVDSTEPNINATREQKSRAIEIYEKSEELIEERLENEKIELENLIREEENRKRDEANKVDNSKITEDVAMDKVASLEEINYYKDKGIRLSYMASESSEEGMIGYKVQVGINGESKFETLGFYFVDSSNGKVYKSDILKGGNLNLVSD